MESLLFLLLCKVETCCGFNLRTGAKIIFWIEIICSALVTGLSTGYLLVSDDLVRQLSSRSNLAKAVFNSLIVNNLVFGLLPSILAWWGDRKNYPSCLRLYMFVHTLDVIRFSAFVLLELSIRIRHNKEPDIIEMFTILAYGPSQVFFVLCVPFLKDVIQLRRSLIGVVLFFCGIIIYTIQWYCVSVIYSHYSNMKRRRNAELLTRAETSVPFCRIEILQRI